jgi:hypothetical protein
MLPMIKPHFQLWGMRGHADTEYDTFFFFRLSSDQGRLAMFPEITWTWESSLGPVDTPPTDYPRATVGLNLVSVRMRKIIDSYLGPGDEVQWIPSVMHYNNEEIPYWIPHFPHTPDVMNTEMSTWGENGVPMRWVLDATKLHEHEFFNAYSNVIIISNRLRLALRKAGITGINPKKARIDC